MTKKDALTIALSSMTDKEAIQIVSAMIEKLSTERTPEEKEKANARRKEKTAAARAEMVAAVIPVLRESFPETPVTAKELYEIARAQLPEDFSAAKIQNILLREMANEVVKESEHNKPYTYRLVR